MAALTARSIVCVTRREQTSSGVARIPNLLHEPLQPLGLEVDWRAHNGQVPPTLVEFVVIGMDALSMSHMTRFGHFPSFLYRVVH